MIRVIEIKVNAAHPNMPLEPFKVFRNSSIAVTILKVPRRIAALALRVKNVSGVERTFSAERSVQPRDGNVSAWSVVIPAEFLVQSGTSTLGVKVEGSDEVGNPFTIGAADLVVMLDDGTVMPVQPPTLTLDDTVTQSSANGVKSSGIWEFGRGLVACKLPVKPLPKYLHALSFDDTYPADAEAWYESLAPDAMGGACSAVRRGGSLYRNYDWTFDSASEFVVRVSAAEGRHASVGVASLGSALSEDEVASGVYTAKFRALPGMTLDGINDAGVVAEINVDGGPKTGWHGDAEDDGIHILAAVRWALDNGASAAQVAEWLADHIIQPIGDMNFHFMIADATKTYIVENGAAHDVTNGAKVLTNYALYDAAHAGGGKERYQLLADGADISAVNWTKAYQTGNDWHSDFESEAQHISAIEQWAAQGADKEAHRGKTTASGSPWWQTVHTSVYDFAAKTLKVAVQESDEFFTFAVGGAKVELDDTVTETSAHGVKSSGIWSFVKGLLPSWLTPSREEPPTQAEVDGKVSKSGDTMTGRLRVEQISAIKEYSALSFFSSVGIEPEYILFVNTILGARGNTPYFPEGLDAATISNIAVPQRTGGETFALLSNIPALVAPSASATNAQAAAALATYNFVNSSVNAIAAFFLAKDDGTSFSTRAELAACTSFLRNGLTGQKPTQNDYTIVVNDETHPIYQAGVFAVYSKWTATADYVGYYVDVTTEGVTAKTLVTAANKDTLGIVVGTTVPYTRIIPTSRYSYQGEWETAGANGWRFQYSINTSGFTVAQLAALNSGVTAELLAQISAALLTIPTSAQKAAWDAKADRASIAPEYSATSAYSVGEFVYRGGRIYRCTAAIAAPGEEWNPAHWSQEQKLDDFFRNTNTLLTATIDERLPYPLVAYNSTAGLLDRTINVVGAGVPSLTVPNDAKDTLIRLTAQSAVTSITFAIQGAKHYGDAFPTAAGDYLITVTRIEGIAQGETAGYYVRTIEMTEAA